MRAITPEDIAFLPADRRTDVVLTGPRIALDGQFDVTALAVASVTDALCAVRDLHAERTGTTAAVSVDSHAAAASFRGEAYFRPRGWELPPLWDTLGGVYRASDGWIRLHTNYATHRAAVERVLGTDDRATAERRGAGWSALELETAVVAAGGAAAAMRSRADWAASAPGQATARTPIVRTTWQSPTMTRSWHGTPALPLAGVRVLDLTRVIAGPVATRVLASYGADVLRIDPPGFAEVAALLPETSRTKRTAALDLRSPSGRAQWERLVTDADVLVCGLRADALADLGFDDDALRALNPDLIIARLNAYGWTGPWRDRRGFDSLVQFSCGIAHATADDAGVPGALPVQALDHATGWSLAAELVRAIAVRGRGGDVGTIHAALVGAASVLFDLPRIEPIPHVVTPMPQLEGRDTGWGPAEGIGEPGTIGGLRPRVTPVAGPLGRDAPVWLLPRD